MSFGERLRKARRKTVVKRSMRQTDLARETGLTPSWISQFENDKRKPNTENLIKLADALEVSVDYLLGRSK